MHKLEVLIFAAERRLKREDLSVPLLLPADRPAIEAAMDCAHIAREQPYNVRIGRWWPGFLTELLDEIPEKTMEELNVLAYRVSKMEPKQLYTYEGALRIWGEEEWHTPFSLKELINLSYGLDHYSFYPDITTDQVVGEVCMMHDLLEWIEQLPDEAYGLFDPEKMGEEPCDCRAIAFTSKGCVIRNEEFHQEIYDGVHLPKLPDLPQGMISLHLKSRERPEGTGTWLELPASEKEIKQILEALEVHALDECVIEESLSDVWEYPLSASKDIEKLNQLAQRINFRKMYLEASEKVIAVLRITERKMQYQEYDLKRERTLMNVCRKWLCNSRKKAGAWRSRS